MIKTLWFFVKIVLLISGAIWLVSQPGQMDFDFLGYGVTVQTGVFLLALCLFVLFAAFLLRMLRAVLRTPKAIVAYREDYQHKIGYRTLTRGLVAVAAGDAQKATEYSKQTKKLLKDHMGLSVLLEAQAARLRGDETLARTQFEALTEDKDMAFLGLRGLMRSALDKGDKEGALDYARDALKLHPQQGWIIRLVYALEAKNNNWDDMLALGKRAVKQGALEANKVTSDNIAVHLMRHDDADISGDENAALRELKSAYKLDPTYVPTVLRYAEYYLKANKSKKAAKLVEAAWAQNAQPDLAELWGRLGPKAIKDFENNKLVWFEKLVEANPSAIEGHVAVAKAAIELKFWGEAKAHLMAAENIYPTTEILHLRALVEKNLTHNDDQYEDVLTNATPVMPEKKWTCIETGMTYDKWSAIAAPHDSFNTIVWDIPRARTMEKDGLYLFQNTSTAI